MTSTDDDAERTRVGLCVVCRNARRLVSAKDSVFYRCELSKIDPAYRDYPPLPVTACEGFMEIDRDPAG